MHMDKRTLIHNNGQTKKMLNISLFNNKNSMHGPWKTFQCFCSVLVQLSNLNVGKVLSESKGFKYLKSFTLCECEPSVIFMKFQNSYYTAFGNVLFDSGNWTIGYLIKKLHFHKRSLKSLSCRCLRFSTTLAAASSRCSSWRWRGWKVSGRPTKAVWGRKSPSIRQEWPELQESEHTDPIRWARRDCITRDRIHKKWCGRSLSRSQSQRKMDLRPCSLKQNFPEVGFYWHLLKGLIHSGNILCPEKGRFALWICE